MKLQTHIAFQKESKNLIDYHSKLILLGSCFSENIGQRFDYFKFQSTVNPFGILFHPKAIETFITNAINEKVYSEKDIIYQNERWHCFGAHSSVSSGNKHELLAHLNTAIISANKELKEASHLVITLGTSWVYRFIETDTIVTNCHKIPQNKFLKELLLVDEVSESLRAITTHVKSVNKNLNIIFTVSPVRHLKDGFIENTQSKSHLIAAIHTIIDQHKNMYYFPSFELMMDELRDYRFYAEDMIHPNKIAIDYIWEKLVASWFSEETTSTMTAIDVIQKGLLHRPFNEKSDEHQQFLKNIQSKKEKIQQQFPFISF